MTAELFALTIKATDPGRLAAFWAGVLGRERDGDTLLPDGEGALRVRFVPGPPRRSARNRAHFDLTSASLDEQRETVERALSLGATHLDVGQGPDAEHVVLADPEGNEFCVIEPGNAFLDGCGRIGALAGDGSQAVGYFWSAALGWPLVWDENEETAIQSPRGGTKITWGGPPFDPQDGEHRLRLELVADDPDAEAERLVSLGATRAAGLVLHDPDGNEFSLASRA